MRPLGVFALLCLALPAQTLVPDVRKRLNAGQRAEAEQLVTQYQQQKGVTPEYLLALSWLGRNDLAGKRYEPALQVAARTESLVRDYLKRHKLDEEKNAPLALGAALEVQAQALAATGRRSEGVAVVRKGLKEFAGTSIVTRLQKNLNLLALEGTPAPPLGLKTVLQGQAKPLQAYRGRPVLLFFWAHWCPDCKDQAPILAQLAQAHPDLVLIAPTQLYGYTADEENAKPGAELKHIGAVLNERYAMLRGVPVPVDQATFTRYGASTTPTLVLVDQQGIVRLYRPGKVTREELEAAVGAVSRQDAKTQRR